MTPTPADMKADRKFGPKCAEVEAIPASDLRDIVRAAIESHIPAEQWNRLKAIEEQERESWSSAMAAMRRVE